VLPIFWVNQWFRCRILNTYFSKINVNCKNQCQKSAVFDFAQKYNLQNNL
jgi:hypothetical protein